MIGQRFYKEPPKGWPALSAFHQRMEHLLSKSLKINKQGSLELTTLELDDQARNRCGFGFMMIWSENWEQVKICTMSET